MLLSANRNPGEIDDRLRDAHAVTTELMSHVIAETCRRYPPIMRTTKSLRIERLIQSGAWTDAALALIELELPQWQVRRIAYDEGEWHCALSRQRESHHADFPLAMLIALVEAQRFNARTIGTSVPTTPRGADPLYEPVCCDNFS
jgi:hypothetical protein